MAERIRISEAGIRFAVRVTPKGGRDAVEGWQNDSAGRPQVKLRVRAAADDGKANDAVTALLAATLGVPKGAVRIAAGATARVKQIEVQGAAEALASRLAAIGDRA
jgi:uncharacterized protein YggU (UPF0235/DUF167 family)